MGREYIRLPKSAPFPFDIRQMKVLDDDVWKNEIFYHLLSFYQNFDSNELKEKIKREKEKTNPRTEREIAKYIRLNLNANKKFGYHFYAFGENTNDEDIEGNYDVTIHSSNWENKNFHIECKNLDKSPTLVNKYVCTDIYPTNKPKKKDGGVYRFFNGKYAQNLNFGGMIGFVIGGNLIDNKTKIISKLKEKFDITPEGDLVDIKDNSIEGNDFTFTTNHIRLNTEFSIHHILFDFT